MRFLCFVVFWFLCCTCYPDFQSGLESFEKQFPGTKKDYYGRAFIPNDEGIAIINVKWYSTVVAIRGKLGDVPRPNVLDVIKWENTVNSVVELNTLAKDFASLFNATLIDVVKGLNETFISFGPNNSFIVKSLTSMDNKKDRMLNLAPNSYPWKKMDDSLRGTIVIRNISTFATVISRLKDKNFPFNASCDNKFMDGRAKDSGYVGVHCKILLRNRTHVLQTELQIHFFDIMDGTKDCPKEYTHDISEKTRTLTLDDKLDGTKIEQEGNRAQKLVFLFGLHRIDPSPPHVSDNLTNAEEYYYMWGALFRKTFSNYNYSHYEMFSPKLGIYFPVNCISGEQDSISLTAEEAEEVEEYLYREAFSVEAGVFSGAVVVAVIYGFFAGGIIVYNYRKPQEEYESLS